MLEKHHLFLEQASCLRSVIETIAKYGHYNIETVSIGQDHMFCLW
jgi:hypothetical protein